MIRLNQILNNQVLIQIREYLGQSTWQDGKLTAGWQAKNIKNNEQISVNDPQLEHLQECVVSALKLDPSFMMAARPKHIIAPRFSRYSTAMSYGDHIDDPIILGSRTDLSLTLFLSAPEDYEGGELIIETNNGTEAVKLAAGDAILYPSTTIHRVAPVRSGNRFVAVIWIRSLIRHEYQREILLDLDIARQFLFNQHGSSSELNLITKSIANLTRCWAED